VREGGRKGLRAYPFTHRQQFLVVGGEGTRESEEEEGMGTGEGQEGVVADDGIADSGLEGGRVRPEGLREGGREGEETGLSVRVVIGQGEREGGKAGGTFFLRVRCHFSWALQIIERPGGMT